MRRLPTRNINRRSVFNICDEIRYYELTYSGDCEEIANDIRRVHTLKHIKYEVILGYVIEWKLMDTLKIVTKRDT